MKMKLVNLLLVLVILSTTAFAGTPLTKQGSKSLFFNFNGLSNLSVDNTSLGGQYIFADNMAIWADISLGFKTSKASETAKDVKDNAIGFDIGFLYYVFEKGPVAMYISPQFGFSTAKNEDDNTKITNTSNYFDAGVSFGVEWWAFDNVSFGASTFLGFESTTDKTENGDVETEATSSNIGILGSSTGTIFIAFHF